MGKHETTMYKHLKIFEIVASVATLLADKI